MPHAIPCAHPKIVCVIVDKSWSGCFSRRPMPIPAHIKFHGLTCFRVAGRYQANLQEESGGGWRIIYGATPREAIMGLFLLPVPDVLPLPPGRVE